MDPQSCSGVELQLHKLSVLILQPQNHSCFLYIVTMHTEGAFSHGQKILSYPPTSMIFKGQKLCKVFSPSAVIVGKNGWYTL